MAVRDRLAIAEGFGFDAAFVLDFADGSLGVINYFASGHKAYPKERLEALQTLHESIVQERQKLTKDVDVISVKAIDHAFWRLAQLLGVVLLVLLAGLWVVRRMISGLFKEWSRLQASASAS